MSKYLLPCSCGNSLEVATTQAGERVTCGRCGAELEVPSLRDLRQLERSGGAAETRRTWTNEQGLVFAAGVLLIVIGLGLGGFLVYKRSLIQTRKPPLPDRTSLFRIIDTWDVLQVLDVWQNEIEAKGLGAWEQPAYVRQRVVARFYEVLLLVSTLVVVGGIGCLIWSLRRR